MLRRQSINRVSDPIEISSLMCQWIGMGRGYGTKNPAANAGPGVWSLRTLSVIVGLGLENNLIH